jgi:signal transduction histidine kinase
MKRLFYIILILLNLFEVNKVIGQTDKVLMISENTVDQIFDPFPFMEYLDDKNHTLQIEDILNPINQKKFKDLPHINVGFSLETKWLRFKLKNLSQTDYYLWLSNPNIDYIDFFMVKGGQVVKQYATGALRPFDTRPVWDNNFIFPMPHQNGQVETIYLRIKTQKVFRLPLKILSAEKLLTFSHFWDVMHGFFFGVCLIILVSNLFLYHSTQDITHLYYLIFIFFSGIFVAYLNGYGAEFIWGNSLFLQSQNAVYTALSGIFYILFLQKFLNTRILSRRLHKLLFFIIFLYLINIVISLFNFVTVAVAMSILTGFFFATISGLILIFFWFRGRRTSIYFNLGIAVNLLLIIIHNLIIIKVLPWQNLTNEIIEWGGLIQMIMFSFALADKINLFKYEKEKAQTANIQLIQQQNKQLEIKVKERTQEIEHQKEEIQSNAEELKVTNERLVELDKFKEGMTGMIVHDLKNPLNTILGLSAQAEVQQAAKQMLNMVLNILDVQKLENASFQIQTADLQLLKIIDEAIYEVKMLIDRKAIHTYIEIPTDLFIKSDFEIAVRIFVNLLTNAIKYTPNNGEIKLKAINEGDWVKMSISDNGQGIPAEKQHLIFDKFSQLEAKQSGGVRSTGLGLTFCKMAIEAQGGRISVISNPEVGTTFEFILPKGQVLLTENQPFTEIIPQINSILPPKVDLLPMEKIQLLPFLAKLQALSVYEYSDVKTILEQINTNGSENLIQWKNLLENAVKACNEEKYAELLDFNLIKTT